MTAPGERDHVSQLEENEPVSEAVLHAVGSVSDRPILELPPLQGSVDTDSLDRLFESSTGLDSLRFEYAGYEVMVKPKRLRLHER